MPGEKPDNTDAGKQTPPEKVEISKAELEEFQAAKKLKDEFHRKAEEHFGKGYTAEDYISVVEEEAYKKLNAGGDAGGDGGQKIDPPPAKKEEKPPEKTVQPQPAGLSEEDRKLLLDSQRSSATALLESQFTRFAINQDKMPKEQQSGYTKQQLMEVIVKRKGTVNDLLSDPQFEGNAFEAASFLLGIDKEREHRAKSAEERNKALEKAKETASTDTGTQTGTTQTGQETKSENDKLADDIAPDAPAVVMDAR